MSVTGQVKSHLKADVSIDTYVIGALICYPKLDVVSYKLSFLNRSKDRNLGIITMQNVLACLFLTDDSSDVMVKLLILELTVLYSESFLVQEKIYHIKIANKLYQLKV